jgi:hypothetical protein
MSNRFQPRSAEDAMERSELRRSLLDYLKARDGERAPLSAADFRVYAEGEVQPAPLAPSIHALIEDALEELATEGFIRKDTGGYTLTQKGRDLGP